MLLALDTGNSDITIGLWNGNEWSQIWRIPSKPDQPEIFYAVKIKDHFLEANIPEASIRNVVISSVVPSLTSKLVNALKAISSREPVVLGPSLYKRLKIEVLNPYEIGTDLVANAVAAFAFYKTGCIVGIDKNKDTDMKAIWNGQLIAESNDTVVIEGNHYFPPDAIKKEFFTDSETLTHCPWKGDASYYSLKVNGKENIDAAWYYPDPKDAAKVIKGRIAFWKGVEIRP